MATVAIDCSEPTSARMASLATTNGCHSPSTTGLVMASGITSSEICDSAVTCDR